MAILAVYAYLLTVFLMNGNWISLAPAQMLAILGLMTYGAPVGSFLNGKTPVVVS